MTAATTTQGRRLTGRLWRIIRPLRVPLGLALILALWPLVQLLWLLALPVGLVWLARRKVDPDAEAAAQAAARVRALREQMARTRPANAIRRTGRRQRRR